MKTNIQKIGAGLLALGICVCCTEVRAQATATVTTTRGAFTEFVPGSETVVVRSETDPTPLRYVVTKQTTVVDETGTPVAIERVTPGSPLSVQYTTSGDRLVASRIVVQHAPVAAPGRVVQERTTTTTTTTAPLTHEEKEALEHREHRAKELKEKREKALEKAKDALEDDDDGH
jgi:hypothetical protein